MEGILYESHYGEMLRHLIQFYNQRVFAYYFDISFEETVARHNESSKKMQFGEDVLESWWKPNDYLSVDGENLLTNDMSQEDVMELILSQLQRNKHK